MGVGPVDGVAEAFEDRELSTEKCLFALACTDSAGLESSAIDDHAVDRRLDSNGARAAGTVGASRKFKKPVEPAAEPERKPEGASQKADAKASWTDGWRVQGASLAQQIRTGRQVRKGWARGRKLSRTVTEGTGGMKFARTAS